MAFYSELEVVQANNVGNISDHTPLNTIFDKCFNIKLEFNHHLALYDSESVHTLYPYHTINTSCMISRRMILDDHKDCSRFINSMLSSTGLPQEFIDSEVSSKVFNYGWRMERDRVNMDLKVLTMVITLFITTPIYIDREQIERAISESSSSLDVTRFNPASKEAIERLEKVRLDNSDYYDRSMCSICLEEYFSIGSKTIQMSCGHLYHGECIVKWLETSHTCPLCRYEMSCANLHNN